MLFISLALSMVSPTHRPSKRIKVASSPRYSDRPDWSVQTSIPNLILLYFYYSVITSSQPVTGHTIESTDGSNDIQGHSVVESFTQPSRFDELIIGTQIPCTPGASQVS